MAMMVKLLLMLLLALSSVSLQDTVKKNSQHRNVLLLNQNLEDGVPEIKANISTVTYRRILLPAKLKQKRETLPSPPINNSKLKWRAWGGSPPNGAVSIYNNYVGRVDYVCKRACHAGFYNPGLGSYCHYTNEKKGYRVSSFEILVNEDNFEILEWKDDSYGSVPQNSVRTCSSGEIFVGKNKYGLGKVDCRKNAFYLPWKNKEYSYKSYQVLTISKDVESEHISSVIYNTARAETLKYPPETMRTSAITNNGCNEVSKTVTLSKTNRVENRWTIGGSTNFGFKQTFSAGIPHVASGNIEITAELTFQASKGQTMTEAISHSISLDLKVPPNHSCKVRMVGYKYKVNIPFTARLSRTYSDGKTTWTSITGTYNSVQVGEVHVVVDRCKPVSGAKRCP